MGQVTSADGTAIAFDRMGSGPVVILVGGGAVDRSENSPLVPELASRFTVYNYDRRGRGESGDTLPYSVQREIEDIAALIADAGGPARLFGASSGGCLVLEAAAAGLPVEKIALYEVPYLMGEMEKFWREYVEQLGVALAEGRRGDAFELFMRLAGSSEEDIAGAKASEYWPGCEAIAPTLAYDAACIGDGPPPVDRLATIRQPTLVMTGAARPGEQAGMEEMPPGFFDQASDAIAASMPGAERRIIEGMGHVVEAKPMAAALEEFFLSP